MDKMSVHVVKCIHGESIVQMVYQFGFPHTIWTDGGPQFWTSFKQFCQNHCKHQELSSPYNPRSNGLVKVTIRSLKQLALKASDQNLEEPLSAWRNTERMDKASPNTLFFGHRCLEMPNYKLFFLFISCLLFSIVIIITSNNSV